MIEKKIEALLFLAGDNGIARQDLIRVLEVDELSFEVAINKLTDSYHDSYLSLLVFGENYKLVTKESIFELAQKLYSDLKEKSLSTAALETLAIIAYKGPINRSEIEKIRGVSSEAIIKKLESLSLIENIGRSDEIGRAFLYQVTDQFLNTFKLESLKDLPPLDIESPLQNLFEE